MLPARCLHGLEQVVASKARAKKNGIAVETGDAVH
jgi:hypothetical protein